MNRATLIGFTVVSTANSIVSCACYAFMGFLPGYTWQGYVSFIIASTVLSMLQWFALNHLLTCHKNQLNNKPS